MRSAFVPLLFLSISILMPIYGTYSPCKPRKYNSDSGVCVCSASYCDSVPPIEPLKNEEAVVFTSTLAGKRLHRSIVPWGNISLDEIFSIRAEVDASEKFQKMFGFGTSFTDAAGINVASLSKKAQDKLLQTYFGSGGIGYTIGRVPIASCDFSTHQYTYDDVEGDFNLTHFKLAPEDLNLKIPQIQKALALTGGKLKLFGSPWTAPAWLKTNGQLSGNGTLIGKAGDRFHQTWANYFIKFLDAYKANNVTFWGLTSQNEPTTGYIYNYGFQTTGYTPETQRDFIKKDLGPALHRNGYQDLKLMILDDSRPMLPQWARTVLSDYEAAKYVSGIALHWYWDHFFPAKLLSATHKEFPSFFLLGTEACTGALPMSLFRYPLLGDWSRGETYASDIIQDVNHWVTGWTDWNLALDLHGGYCWTNGSVDSPIIVNKTADEFYKQPMFYTMAHFSAFVPPGSVRIGLKLSGVSSLVSGTAFLTPEGHRILVILNRIVQGMEKLKVSEVGGRSLTISLELRSITTIIWKQS